MARIITLKRAASCADCGTTLPVGTRARWYRNGSVYGLDCHEATPRARRGSRARRRTAYEQGDTSPGAIASHYDPHGLYTLDGRKIATSCGCEDYPCCGH
jgi:hypothetical protein